MMVARVDTYNKTIHQWRSNVFVVGKAEFLTTIIIYYRIFLL